MKKLLFTTILLLGTFTLFAQNSSIAYSFSRIGEHSVFPPITENDVLFGNDVKDLWHYTKFSSLFNVHDLTQVFPEFESDFDEIILTNKFSGMNQTTGIGQLSYMKNISNHVQYNAGISQLYFQSNTETNFNGKGDTSFIFTASYALNSNVISTEQNIRFTSGKILKRVYFFLETGLKISVVATSNLSVNALYHAIDENGTIYKVNSENFKFKAKKKQVNFHWQIPILGMGVQLSETIGLEGFFNYTTRIPNSTVRYQPDNFITTGVALRVSTEVFKK